jgi:hypothetical protein
MDEQKARLSSLRVCLGPRNLANDLIQVHLVLGRLAESAAELRGANTKPRTNLVQTRICGNDIGKSLGLD